MNCKNILKLPGLVLALLPVLITAVIPIQALSQTVVITIESDIYNYAKQILGDKSAIDIEDFSGAKSQRDVVEFILAQKALALGGVEFEFTFEHGNYDAKNPKLLQSGMLLVSFDSIWLEQAKTIQDDVYISDALVRKGEYFAGIYTSPNNKKALAIHSLSDLKKMTIISNKHWYTDWKTLGKIVPKELIHEEEWLAMAKLVSLNWVDIMLAPFTAEPPFEYKENNYHIVAVKGVKIALDDSRHFLVSKKHPLGKETFAALQKGLKILRENGTIEKAYRQSGFINNKVNNWAIINRKK